MVTKVSFIFFIKLNITCQAKPAAAPATPKPTPAVNPTTPQSAPAAHAASTTPAPSDTPATTTATPAPSATGNTGLATGAVYESAVSNLVEMGFERAQVVRAMRAAFNNPDRAAEYLMTVRIFFI